MEVEAEAVNGRLKEAEAEAKEKLTAVASLLRSLSKLVNFGHSHHRLVVNSGLGVLLKQP